MTVAARSSTCARLGRDARGWANDRFAYTHGYGVVAVSRGGPTHVGEPRFTAARVRRPTCSACASRASTTPSARGRAAVPGREQPPRRGRPPARDAVPTTTTTAAAASRSRARSGAPRSPIALRRPQAAADRDGHRPLADRAAPRRAATGCARWRRSCAGTRDPQTVVVGGRVQFLFHGYTTSESYPVLGAGPLGGARQLHARAARSPPSTRSAAGSALYADDADDPILRAWRAAFPSLFQPFSQMPDELRAHLRYPRRCSTAQADAVRDLPRGRADRVLERRGRLAARRSRSRGRSRTPARSTSPIRRHRCRRARETGSPGLAMRLALPAGPAARATDASASCSPRRSRRAGARTSSATWPARSTRRPAAELVAAQPAARPARRSARRRPPAGSSPSPEVSRAAAAASTASRATSAKRP